MLDFFGCFITGLIVGFLTSKLTAIFEGSFLTWWKKRYTKQVSKPIPTHTYTKEQAEKLYKAKEYLWNACYILTKCSTLESFLAENNKCPNCDATIDSMKTQLKGSHILIVKALGIVNEYLNLKTDDAKKEENP